ncbi:MAG: autotransporter outer membrane beta-barrel domain-containing protein [Burkholderiales bacterium]
MSKLSAVFRIAILGFSLVAAQQATAQASTPTTGLACAKPGALGNSVYLSTGAAQAIPRFQVNLTDSEPTHAVKNDFSTAVYIGSPGYSDYVPSSVANLVDPTGLFRQDYFPAGDPVGTIGTKISINGVEKLKARTEPWYQPLLFNLSGSRSKTIYINSALTQEGQGFNVAYAGWCDVAFAATPGYVTRQDLIMAVNDPLTIDLIKFGLSKDQNPSKQYFTLANLELVGVNLSFLFNELKLVPRQPSTLNHTKSLKMLGGRVLESNVGETVILKLIDSSINFGQIGFFGADARGAQSNLISIAFWAAVDPSDASKNTSSLSFESNNSALGNGARVQVFVDQNASLNIKQSGILDKPLTVTGVAGDQSFFVATPWEFYLGNNAKLLFSDAYIDFHYNRFIPQTAIPVLSSMTLSDRAELRLDKSNIFLGGLNLRKGASNLTKPEATVKVNNNSLLALEFVQVNSGVLNFESDQSAGFNIGGLVLSDADVKFSGERTRPKPRPGVQAGPVVQAEPDVRGVEFNSTSTLTVDGFYSTGLSFGKVVIGGGGSDRLTINIAQNAPRPGFAPISFGGFSAISAASLPTVINLSPNSSLLISGRTESLIPDGSRPEREKQYQVDINLGARTTVDFFGGSRPQPVFTVAGYKDYVPLSFQPINLGPFNYNLKGSEGSANIFYEAFLNPGFGNDLTGVATLNADTDSRVFVGDSCVTNDISTCIWKRNISSLKIPQLFGGFASFYYDISLDSSGRPINDKISTTRADLNFANFVVDLVPTPGSNKFPSAQELDGQTFYLFETSDIPNSVIRPTPELIAGNSIPAATRLFFIGNPGITKQVIIGAQTDLGQLQRRVGSRNQRGLAQSLSLTGPVSGNPNTPTVPGSGNPDTPIPFTAAHQGIALSSGVSLATALSTLNGPQWDLLSKQHGEPFASFMTVGLEQSLMAANMVMNHATGSGEFINKSLAGLPVGKRDVAGAVNERKRPRQRLWGDLQYSKGSVKSQGDLAGYKYQVGAMIFGSDFFESESTTAGAFTALGFSDMSEHDFVNSSFRSTGLNFGVYGRHSLPKDVNLTATLGVNYSFIDSRRNIPNVGSFQGGKLTSDYNSWGGFAGLRLDRSYPLSSKRSYITPVVELSYARQSFESAAERGSRDVGFNLGSGRADALLAGLGFDASHAWEYQGNVFAIDALVRYEHDFFANSNPHHSLNKQSQLTNQFSTVYAIDRGANGLSAGLALTMILSESASWGMGYKYSSWSHGTQHQFGANLTVRW